MRLIEELTKPEIENIILNEKGDKIPTLEEVFNLCRDKIKINIELKGINNNLPENIIRIIKENNMQEQVYLSSFHHPFYQLMLDAQKKYNLNQFIKFAFLFYEKKQFPDLNLIPKGNQLNFSSMLIYDQDTVEFIYKAKQQYGLTLSVYFGFDCLETENVYKRIVQLGINSIITNQPHTLQNFRLKYFNY